MAAPTIAPASIVTINSGTSTAGSASPTLKASGNDRILVIAFVHKDNSATPAVPSAITVDSAGVNSTLANGKVVQQGTLQLAQESTFSSTCDVYFCLEANLPTVAGSYVVNTTLDSGAQYHMVQIFEIAGCPAQAYDAIIQNFSTADVSGGVAFSASITPTVNDCLVVDIWATSHSAAPTFTSTESQMAVTSNTNGGSVTSQFTQTTAAAKSMQQSSSTLHQRRAFTLLSFSGASANTIINATVDPLAITTYGATINAAKNVLVNTTALTLSENVVTVSNNVNVQVTTHVLSLTENQVIVNAAKNINVSVHALTMLENQANVNAETNVNTTLHALSLTGNSANIGGVTNVNANVHALTLTENQAIINAETNVNTVVHALSVTTYAATITLSSGNTNVNATVHALSVVGNIATINAAKNITSITQALVITGNVVSISTGQVPTSQGLEYSVSGRLLHYTFDDEKLNYTMQG